MDSQKLGRLIYAVIAWVLGAIVMKLKADHPMVAPYASEIAENILFALGGWVLKGPNVLPGVKTLCMAFYCALMVMCLAACDMVRGASIRGSTKDGTPYCYGPACQVPVQSANPMADQPTRAP
jgi:hypothetical protein